jgi:hypothetical protein
MLQHVTVVGFAKMQSTTTSFSSQELATNTSSPSLRVSQRRRLKRRATNAPRPPHVAWTARNGTTHRCPSIRPSWPVPAGWRLRGRATYYAPCSPRVAGNASELATHCCSYARPPGLVRATHRSGPARRRSACPSGHYHTACPGEPTRRSPACSGDDPTGRSSTRAAGSRDTTGQSPNHGAAPRGRRCGATSGPNRYRSKCSINTG